MAVQDGSAGCEFLDDGNYGALPPAFTANRWSMPIEVAKQLAIPARLEEVAKEIEYIRKLEQSISRHGIIEYLELRCDPNGAMYLKDGHHRIVVALNLGLSSVPVFVVMECEEIRRGHRVIMLPSGVSVDEWMMFLERKKRGP